MSSSASDRLLIVAETSKPEMLDWRLSKTFTENLRIDPPSVNDKELILKVSEK